MNNSCLSGVEGIWQGDLVSVSAILDLRTPPQTVDWRSEPVQCVKLSWKLIMGDFWSTGQQVHQNGCIVNASDIPRDFIGDAHLIAVQSSCPDCPIAFGTIGCIPDESL